MHKTEFKNRLNLIIPTAPKTKKKPIDADVLDYLQPLAERLEIPVEELALNLHIQGIYKFLDIEEILGLDIEEIL